MVEVPVQHGGYGCHLVREHPQVQLGVALFNHATQEPSAYDYKKQFSALVNALLPPEQPAAFNQALMDFGAMCCTPAQPDCGGCPLLPSCLAARANRVSAFPVRAKKLEKKARFFLYLMLRQGDDIYLQKRSGQDIWRGLYEFPMLEVESAAELTQNTVEKHFFSAVLPKGATWGKSSPHLRQILTHQLVLAAFLELHLPLETNPDIFTISVFKNSFKTSFTDVKKKFAFPRVVLRFFEKNV